METFETLKDPLISMLPFIGLYYIGLSVRVSRNNRGSLAGGKIAIDFALVGDAIPGLIEMIVTMAAVFGILLRPSAETTSFQLLGMWASAAYIAFRSGYTYSESLVGLKYTPVPIKVGQT